MKMKDENKKEIKKNIITGVSTATGAVLGSLIENTFNPMKANAKEVDEPEIIEAIASDETKQEVHPISTTEAEISSETIEVEVAVSAENPSISASESLSESHESMTSAESVDEGIVEVIGYAEGSDLTAQSPEMAVIENPVDDNEIPVISEPVEVFNTEEIINQGEVSAPEDMFAENIFHTDMTDTRISPLGNEDLTASSLDIPDYVNDANIDSFMDMA